MGFKKLSILTVLCIFLLAACAPTKANLSNPEIVTLEFMQNQAAGNHRAVNALVTKELKKKLQEQKLYLDDRLEIKNGTLEESQMQIAWDEPEKKVYQLKYTVKYTHDKETKNLHLKEAVSLVKKGQDWYIDDYAPEKK